MDQGPEPVEVRADALSVALQSALQLVVIQLTATEDSQEIFETLNARGTPLTAADLIKNYVFQRLIDQPSQNANLDFVLTEAVDVVAALRGEGRVVFVHCAEARSRTAAVAALYGMRHRGVKHDQAWDDVASALPYYAPADFHREAIRRMVES